MLIYRDLFKDILNTIIFVYQFNPMIQQTIQEVKFEDIIISKKQRQARKTNKLRHWLEYLNMLDENKDHAKKNNIIKQMHSMFILRQDFWIREIKRVLNDESNLSVQSFQFAFMALEDGFYLQAAQLIAQKLFEAYIKEKIRLNFMIAKIQILIAQFDFFTKECTFFFEMLLRVYFQTNNVKKIRETFQRQISMGLDDYDVSYALYIKWQEKQLKMNSINEVNLLEKGKSQWQRNKTFIQDQLPKIQISDEFLCNEELKSNQKHVKRCLYYIQDLNTARIDEIKYLKLLDMLAFEKDKLWYLRRLALSQTHELVQQYFQALQLSQADEQQIINTFRLSFNWQNGQKYESLYLSFLIRRINKHVMKPQDQEYNNQWGQNVQFFRNQISQLISRQRLNSLEQKVLINKYYYLWIDVQTSLVKDKATVQQLFESLLNWGQSEQIYIDYADCMIKLCDVPKAKWILNKTYETYGAKGKVAKQYQKFLSIYGTLQEVIKFKKNNESSRTETSKQPQKVIAKEHNHHEIKPKKQTKLVEQKDTTKNVPKISQNTQPQKIENKPEVIPNEDINSLKRAAPHQDNRESHQNHTLKKKVHLDSQNTLFSNKLNKNWTEADIMLNLVYKQNVNQIRIIDKQSDRICYIEFDSQQSAQKQLNQNKSKMNLAFSQPPSKSDDRTLFLCNFPLECSKQQIKQILPKQYQDLVKDIRIKQKNDKKTAYIEFNSQQVRDEVLSELKKQKIKFGERSIIAMSCSIDHKDNKDKKNKTIFLKNLSFKCKEKDIRQYFEQKGLTNIQQIFIPKDDKTKKVKGYAYVEFENHDEMQKALQLQKGNLSNRQFTISRSDRPITHHQPQHDSKQSGKDKNDKKLVQENKKSNNFFSNIFS